MQECSSKNTTLEKSRCVTSIPYLQILDSTSKLLPHICQFFHTSLKIHTLDHGKLQYLGRFHQKLIPQIRKSFRNSDLTHQKLSFECDLSEHLRNLQKKRSRITFYEIELTYVLFFFFQEFTSRSIHTLDTTLDV